MTCTKLTISELKLTELFEEVRIVHVRLSRAYVVNIFLIEHKNFAQCCIKYIIEILVDFICTSMLVSSI